MNELLVVTPNGYKTSKLYSVVPANGTGDLTWVRNTTATRVNSSGLIESVGANVPRLDYTGGVTCPCILVEPQRTNNYTYSEQFDNGVWSKNNFNTAGSWTNQISSPDGAATADKLIPNTVNNLHFIRRDFTGVDNTVYTFSIFVKAAEYSRLSIEFVTQNGLIRGATFNLTTQAISPDRSGNYAASYSITSYGSDWYRLVITQNINTGGTSERINIIIVDDSGNFSFAGNDVKGLYLWGAQLETASTVSSYIPTTSGTVTRNADVATVTTPVGITSLIETYEDNTTNVVNPIPVTYQMSEGRIAKVVGL